MDSTQLAYITELAHKCPMDNTVANAQAILYLLYGIEVEDCVEYTNRSKHSLVKDIDFVLPDTDAWIEENFPNPFTDKTYIDYYVPEGSEGSIFINDMYGRKLAEHKALEGENILTVEKGNLAPGIYSYGLIVDGQIIEFKKLVIKQ
ncbi:MAG: T9SS type A sorting domain-containing protein [Bacteroidales bacterium]|nr:T9SS type A sorting domain-containing protein [Bacteroidales bacterium]